MMYHEHFGLERPILEQGLSAPEGLFVGERQREVMDLVGFGLGAPDSVTVVSGPHGVGKTVLTQAALERGGTRQATIRLMEVGIQAADLPEMLLAELGVAAHRLTRVERIQLLRQTFGELEATASRLYVIVERADAADVSVLRALEVLTAQDPAGFAGANLLLHGTAAIEETLSSPALEPLCQRVRQRVEVAPLGVAQATAYWRHKLELAGGDPDRILGTDAPEALYRCSAGIPRVMDRIGDAALALAAEQGESALTPAHVDEAARRNGALAARTGHLRTGQAGPAVAGQAGVPVLTDAVDDSGASDDGQDTRAGDDWVDRVLSA
jgi:general secretion pathway protein A